MSGSAPRSSAQDGQWAPRRSRFPHSRIAVMSSVRPCADNERPTILAIVNAAAEAYRGAIPEDRWHEPYMPSSELDSEIAAGGASWGYEAGGALVGVMVIQPGRDVELI